MWRARSVQRICQFTQGFFSFDNFFRNISHISICILKVCYWIYFKAHEGIFYKCSPPEVFLRKGVLEICSKFTGEHPCRSVISIKLQSNFIEIALRRGYSPVNLVHIVRTPFSGNTSGWLLLFLDEFGHFINFRNGYFCSSLISPSLVCSIFNWLLIFEVLVFRITESFVQRRF